ncbi:MAG TPA: glycosyltransferase [Planctomycetes bacterium]|nr:glycosyltransferase [Planctomycetota bacterium]
MRIACINQDPGISPKREKGAAIHLTAMRDAFTALGAEVCAFDEPDGAVLGEALDAEHGSAPFEIVYERYALGAEAATRFAERHGVFRVLEVNAPLEEEARRWRAGIAPCDEAGNAVFSGADLVVCVSEAVARYAAERGAQRRAIQVFPNGVDLERFRPWSQADGVERAVPEGRFVLGMHGRLRPWHGFERFARAARDLLGRGVDLHLLLVGSGDYRAHLENHVPRSRVTLVPWVPHHRVGEFVAQFDCLPLTYPPDLPCYFSPLKLAEAMACGVVPVVPRLGDLSTVVEEGVAGLFYEAERLESLVDRLEELACDRELRARLARGAREAAARLGWTRIAGSVLDAASGGVVR